MWWKDQLYQLYLNAKIKNSFITIWKIFFYCIPYILGWCSKFHSKLLLLLLLLKISHQCKAKREWKHSLGSKTHTLKEEKEKIAGDKKKQKMFDPQSNTITERNQWYILTHLFESGYCLQINPNYQVNWPNC